MPTLEESRWGRSAPWTTTVVSVVVLVALAVFLVENVYWFRTTALDSAAATDPAYLLYVFQLHGSLLKRAVGLFVGFSLVFLGSSMVFYTLRRTTSFEGASTGLSAKLSTASPGIVTMVLGAALVAFTISSKDQFPAYAAPKTPAVAATENAAPAVQPQR